jgi:type II secretory pathway component PulJ
VRQPYGFTLLEALAALAVLTTAVVVGLESVGLGAAARRRAAEYAEFRLLAERKLAEVAVMFGPDIRGMVGITEGHFEAPFEDAVWMLEVSEDESGTGLFVIDLEVQRGNTAIQVSTLVNRFGDLWAQRRGGP